MYEQYDEQDPELQALIQQLEAHAPYAPIDPAFKERLLRKLFSLLQERRQQNTSEGETN